MKRILLFTILAAGTFLANGVAWATPVYNVTDLGTLGGDTSMAYAVNDAGMTAGTATNIFGNMSATSYGVVLVMSGGATESCAWGVNDGNQISGTQFIAGQSYSTVWSNGAPQLIAGAGSYGTGINDNGDVTGMFTNAAGEGQAFVTIDGVMQPLGTFQSSFGSSGYAINNSDQVAGYAQTWSGMRAFFWSAQTGYVALDGLGGANSYALAINTSGQVAGHAQTSSGFTNAVLWTGGTAKDLGTLDGGNSYAYGIDDAGDVVGYSGSHAFLYQDGVMLDLNNLIDPNSGWTLTQAYAINSLGEIAGAGLFNGVEHAFVLDPAPTTESIESFSSFAQNSVVTPEPTAWSLVLLGLMGVAGMKAKGRVGSR